MSFAAMLKEQLLEIRGLPLHINLAVPQCFAKNLVFMYHVMRACENLLEVAIKQTEEGVLKRYFVEHLAEERSHEKWLADDLASIGIEVGNTPISREAVQMAGSAYWFIYHVHPVSLLGYMAALEFLPMPLEQVELLETLHGKDVMRCLRFHAEHDIEHGQDLSEMIDGLNEQEQQVVLQTAIDTALYAQSAFSSFN
jgi:hypothetical protein